MQLKLAKKKEINEDVLRMIIQYGLGFASRVKNLENKEIEDWKEDKLYEKGAKVLYNNYLWVAKVTNQSSAWNESYWEKVGDNLELIEKSDIEAMLGLTTDELQTLASIILDSEVRLDKTWSSSKIYTDLQQCLNDSKKFTLDQFAKANKASYQVITNLSSATDKSIIYLMANGSNYDMYIVESDGTPTKIGDTTIDLSQFYTKTEIDNDFVKKTDADGKYALITTVSNHISDTVSHMTQSEKDSYALKSSITDTINSTSTSTDIASARGVYDALDKKIDKTSIATSIDSSSTDSELPTAKTIYEKTKNMCTTTVKDIPKTDITFTDTTHFEQFDIAVENGYQVKNGICYVNLNIKCNSTSTNGFNIKSGMPKPNFSIVHGTITPFAPFGTGFKKELTFSINSNGVMALFGGEPGCRYLGSFSYPVAES